MKTTIPISVSLLTALLALSPALPGRAAPPITVDTKNLLVQVDAENARWSAQVKGTPMQMNDVHFLPGDDASGWAITSRMLDESNNLGSFVTVELHGTKAGQLDFDYRVSASKTNNDILVSLGRLNNTGKAVDIGDMDYFVSSDARLGGTEDKWVTLGTYSRNRDYYEFWAVINMTLPKTYQVNHVIRDSDTGNSLLMGHVTTLKGVSRFEVAMPNMLSLRAPRGMVGEELADWQNDDGSPVQPARAPAGQPTTSAIGFQDGAPATRRRSPSSTWTMPAPPNPTAL